MLVAITNTLTVNTHNLNWVNVGKNVEKDTMVILSFSDGCIYLDPKYSLKDINAALNKRCYYLKERHCHLHGGLPEDPASTDPHTICGLSPYLLKRFLT